MVVVPFPFSDLTHAKRRPALVLAALPGEDVILCQITSVEHGDPGAIRLDSADFVTGQLKRSSFVRPTRLFTADRRIILYRAGSHRSEKMAEVGRRLAALVNPAG